MLGQSRALFFCAAVAYAPLLVWLGWNGFPRFTTDAIVFKQPAQTYVQTGVFARPTYGKLPHTMLVLGEYPPVYVFANALAFAGLGFDYRASLALDLGIHFLLVLALGGAVLHLARSSVPAIAYLFLSSSLLLPIGRPEELGALFVVTAIWLAGRREAGYWIANPLLGLGLATAPSLGLTGIGVFVVFDGLNRGWNPGWLRRSAATGLGAFALLTALWGWTVWPHFTEASEQFAAAVTHPLRWTPTLLELFVGPRSKPAWAIPFLASTTALLVLTAWRSLARPETVPKHVRALALSVPFAIGVHALLQRPGYDYRLLGHLLLAGSLGLAYTTALDTRAGPWMRRTAIAMGSLVVAITCIANFRIVQYVLAPLAWDASATSFAAAQQQIDEQVPADASVGGQAELFMAIQDGRPYYAIHWLSDRPWPEYILSSTFIGDGAVSHVLQRNEWTRRLERDYEELTTSRASAGCEIELPLIQKRIPVSRSPCDWNIRIWKRRAAPDEDRTVRSS